LIDQARISKYKSNFDKLCKDISGDDATIEKQKQAASMSASAVTSSAAESLAAATSAAASSAAESSAT
jgi:hypothetical protein